MEDFNFVAARVDGVSAIQTCEMQRYIQYLSPSLATVYNILDGDHPKYHTNATEIL
jgi:hypothetical protein